MHESLAKVFKFKRLSNYNSKFYKYIAKKESESKQSLVGPTNITLYGIREIKAVMESIKLFGKIKGIAYHYCVDIV